MSNDDDRMDRARRIRRMREGDDDRSPTAADDQPTEGGAGAAGDQQSSDGAEGPSDGDGEESPPDETEMEWGAPGSSATGDGDDRESATGDDTEDRASAGEGDPDGGASGAAAEEESPSTGGGSDADAGAAAVPEAAATATAGATTGGGGATAQSPADAAEGGSDLGADDSAGIDAPLPEADQLEEALDEAGADSEAETVTPDVTDDDADTDESGEETRVLEFTLHDEHYCLDIEYIEEIVKQETITRVPNTPAFVEGVVDLRGQITTILNPKITLEKEDHEAGELIVVFDDEAFEDQGHVGWVVDDVRQVSLITDDDVNEPPVDDDHINGVIDRGEEEFVVWTTPRLVMDEAE